MELQTRTDFFSEINKAVDPDNLTVFERLHLPMIYAPDIVKAGEWFEIKVEVGTQSGHPNENVHFIEFFEIYIGQVYLARMDLTAVKTLPVLKVTVKFDKNIGPLRAFARCNVHGVWEASKTIRVQ